MINTHHHFYQTLTRAVPGAQDAGLFDWLRTLYPIWAGITPEDIYISTQTALAELALSGCTTASDHLYIYPNGSRLDDEIEAALEIVRQRHGGPVDGPGSAGGGRAPGRPAVRPAGRWRHEPSVRPSTVPLRPECRGNNS